MGGAKVKETGGNEARKALKATVRSLDLLRGQKQITGDLKQVNILILYTV